MIRYTCTSCGAKLETDILSGQTEPCPTCGKLNRVPLSKHDQAEARKQDSENRRRQEEELRQDVEAQARHARGAREAWQAAHAPEEQPQPAIPRQDNPEKPSLTETALCYIGLLLTVLGCICGAVAGGSIVGESGQAVAPSLVFVVLITAAGTVAGFILGMPFFAAKLVLEYLRRITNAVEGQK